MKRTRRNESDPLGMELTPMIDVVFNLLIFFMLQSFKTNEGVIQAYLPKHRGLGDGVQLQCVNEVRVKCLWVDAGGSPVRGPGGFAVLKIGYVQLTEPGDLAKPGFEHHPGWAQLSERLAELDEVYMGEPGALPVILDARPEVPTQVVVLALNEVVRAGIRDVNFAAPERP